MPQFIILIDDGEYVASDATTTFADMDAAVGATLTAAMHIAGERAVCHNVEQCLSCEVQQYGSAQRRAFDVLLRVEARL